MKAHLQLGEGHLPLKSYSRDLNRIYALDLKSFLKTFNLLGILKVLSYVAFLFILILTAEAGQSKPKFEGVLNKLLAPGPLMDGHKKLEHADCLSCHDPGGGVPNKGCLECHKGIETQVRNKKSFHGLMGNKLCVDCHKDHKGRDYNAVGFDTRKFNHTKTGFPLTNAHAISDCSKCHTKRRRGKHIDPGGIRWFGTSSNCIDCHRDDDIHKYKGKMAKVSCGVCHKPTRWKDTKPFDHKKVTGYALIGTHKRQKCAKCHAPRGKGSERYTFPSLKTKKCLTCHKDHHKSRLSAKFRGGKCDTCHNQYSWRIKNFNHNITGFPLKGKHAKNSCGDCHKQSKSRRLGSYKFAGLSTSCVSCHKDFHGYGDLVSSRLGTLRDCSRCHVELGWKRNISFNHNTQTIFPIEGKHRKNDCFQCHVTKKGRSAGGDKNELRRYHFKNLSSRTCETCHKSPHSKSFHRKFKSQKCSNCHSPKGWNVIGASSMLSNGDRKFHEATRFPLTGKHKNQPCKACHTSKGKGRFKFPNAAKGFCINCHESVHKDQFSPKFLAKGCGDCHTTSTFSKRKSFDHNQTEFRITGRHREFEKNCRKCHVSTRKKLPTSPPKTAHKYQFDFKEKGYCESCHLNVHKRQFSPEFNAKSACIDCHTTNSFTNRKPFDHDVTRFKITGRHLEFRKECSRCHTPTRRKLPTNPPKVAHKFQFSGASKGFCENCHKNEHRDMFRPKFYTKPCEECHRTTTWKSLKPFNHSKTNFPLRYRHRRVDCKECHVRTMKRFTQQGDQRRKGRYNFPDLSLRNCNVCHTDPHRGTNGKLCTKCHTEAGWSKTDGFHKDFNLNGVHLVLGCDQCHQEDKILRGSSDDCRVCHGSVDPHNGALQNCTECHSQTMWEATFFSHDMTQFPLRGVHRLTDCRSCHNQGNYQSLPRDCVGCHAGDASNVVSPDHSSARYQSCEQCHNTFSFSSPTSP